MSTIRSLIRGAALLGALCAVPSLAQAATFTVTTTSYNSPSGLGAALAASAMP